MLHNPAGEKPDGALEVQFLRDGEQIARNVQPLSIEPGKFGYRLVRAELEFPEAGTVEAVVGVSLRWVESAPMASNCAVMPQCSSSPPPARTMSCAPWRMRSAPAPMQCADVAQAALME